MVNSKQKGGEFERETCKHLSLWVTGGERRDSFWRSAMSGGRATVAKGAVRQAGDICAVAEEGHSLTDRFYLECKFYKDLNIDRFFLEAKGAMAGFWRTTCQEAEKYGKVPALIAKQNLYPTLFLVAPSKVHLISKAADMDHVYVQMGDIECEVYNFKMLMETPYNEGRVRLK